VVKALDYIFLFCLELLHLSTMFFLEPVDGDVAVNNLLQLEHALPTQELSTTISSSHSQAQHMGQNDLELPLSCGAKDPTALTSHQANSTHTTWVLHGASALEKAA
jgi:hypothetical protein